MIPSGVHHVAIQVRDLPACERFYRDVLGLPFLRRWPLAEGPGDRSVWLDLGQQSFLALELVTALQPCEIFPSDTQPGFFVLALRIGREERAAWRQRLAQMDVAIYRESSYTLYLKDPEGNRIGLSHFPELKP